MDELYHYGVPRRSGRYPWGSGKDPQRSSDILSKVDDLRAKGLSQTQIAEKLGMTTTKLRSEITWANEKRKSALIESIKTMNEDGKSNSEIARRLSVSEGTVRNYLKNGAEQTTKGKVRQKQLENISNVLTEAVDKHKYLDISSGTELQIGTGISREKLKAVKQKLLESGEYYEHKVYLKNLTNQGQYLTISVLTKEKDLEVVKKNADKIRPIESWTDDGGITFQGLKPIKHISWDRIKIRYGEEGGEDKDGVMELRRGVSDLDLGGKKYAQVRIGVEGTHYLKGMALYTDEKLPNGVDIIFNTNKPKGTPKEKVLKELKDNPDNPFGATIKPGGQRGAINIVNEEGDWNAWKSTLSAQMLSKQPVQLVRERLTETKNKLWAEFDDLNSLTNPIVKKHLMGKFSEDLESKSRHLKVMGLPRTKGHVILPFPDMKPTEVYAPNYKDGERVVLIRYPHGGIFEIPELIVNNKSSAKKTIGGATDAIGIHPSVAKKLSGADFDGDTVYVIPNNSRKIKSAPALKELENFDPHQYAVNRETMNKVTQQSQMGIVSNLITDMTIKGATNSEIARAVKHSMVVIDAKKHKLDWQQSAIDNGITALRRKYTKHTDPISGKTKVSGSTIISRSKKKVAVEGQKEKVSIFEAVGDARKLSSGRPVENLYADYVNDLRKKSISAKRISDDIKGIKRSPEAAKRYSEEVKSLNEKLFSAELNSPRERQAQILASKSYYSRLEPNMTSDDRKKLRAQTLSAARIKVGSKRENIEITDREWEAIQAGAISTNKLENILNFANIDRVRELATPRQTKPISDVKIARAKQMLASGYTYSQVSDSLGYSISTLRAHIHGKE